jgi:hypothetical protein
MADYVDVVFESMGMRIPARLERTAALTILRKNASRSREEKERPSGDIFVDIAVFVGLLKEPPGPVSGEYLQFPSVLTALNWLRSVASENEAVQPQKSIIDSRGDGKLASLLLRMKLFMVALGLPSKSVRIISRN